MFFGLFGGKRKSANQRIVIRLYEMLTSAGRRSVFYEEMHVPDTVMGRFEMLALHVVLFVRRSMRGGEPVKAIGQEIVDEFFLDIDHSIRELGIGDMSVPKKMKKFVRMFYGRFDSYARAIEAGDEPALADALRRNIHPEDAGAASDMRPLAVYVLQAEAALGAMTDDIILRGDELVWPTPRLVDAQDASA